MPRFELGDTQMARVTPAKDIRSLYDRLRALSWPVLAKSIGDFALYESLLVGCADRAAQGHLVEVSEVPTPDEEASFLVSRLRMKGNPSHDERAFLEYFDLLDEIRSALIHRRYAFWHATD
jgi:hypothetical protein